MRTNIVIDDKLMKQAMKLSGLSTKKSVVEESLRLFVQMQKQKKIPAQSRKRNPLLQFAGTITDEDAEEMLRVIYSERSSKPLIGQ